MKVLYFAWLRERAGTSEEEVDPPSEVASARDLAAWLAARSEGHASAFADLRRVRVAIDQTAASLDATVAGAREVAFFPPMTGG